MTRILYLVLCTIHLSCSGSAKHAGGGQTSTKVDQEDSSKGSEADKQAGQTKTVDEEMEQSFEEDQGDEQGQNADDNLLDGASILISSSTILENNEINAAIGTISVVDANNEQIMIVLSLPKDHPENSVFKIASDGTTLLAMESFDFETQNTYELLVEATDVKSNASISQILEIVISDQSCNDLNGFWISVPGNPDYGTIDFCVMKYEAKCSLPDGQTCNTVAGEESPISIAANTPWVEISQQEALAECSSIGSGFQLISNEEWMTIAENIASQDMNWSNGTIGSGQLIRGHSDGDPYQACAASEDDSLNVVETDCTNKDSAVDEFIEQRTSLLSNGEVIWDLAGNIWEVTSYFNADDKPSPLGFAWNEFTDISGTLGTPILDLIPQIAIDNSWDSSFSLGRYFAGDNATGGALHRGGRFYDTINAGIFTAGLSGSTTGTGTNFGFRCTTPEP